MADNKPQAKYSVVVLKAKDTEAVARFLTTKLNRPFDEVKKLVAMAPATVATDLEPIWAEDMVQNIKALGADAEKRLIPSSLPCEFHPSTPGKTVCKLCTKVICAQCIKDAGGQPICPDCTGASKKIDIPFPWLRLVLIIAFIGVSGFAYYTITKERAPFPWGERPYKLALVGFMVDPSTQMKAVADQLAKSPGMGIKSLPDMAAWFQTEYERYGNTGTALEIQIFGPFEYLDKPPNPPDPSSNLLTRIFDYRAFKSFFRTFDAKNDLDLKEFDGVIYVQVVEGDFDGFVESWASRRDNIGLAKVIADPALIEMDVMIVLHEYGHLINAKDHYGEDGTPIVPDGFINPFQEPLYPQKFGDLMSGGIPIAEGAAPNIKMLRDMRIGIYTAHEIGWLDDEQFQNMLETKELPDFE